LTSRAIRENSGIDAVRAKRSRNTNQGRFAKVETVSVLRNIVQHARKKMATVPVVKCVATARVKSILSRQSSDGDAGKETVQTSRNRKLERVTCVVCNEESSKCNQAPKHAQKVIRMSGNGCK
jgi:hypothetical protein